MAQVHPFKYFLLYFASVCFAILVTQIVSQHSLYTSLNKVTNLPYEVSDVVISTRYECSVECSPDCVNVGSFSPSCSDAKRYYIGLNPVPVSSDVSTSHQTICSNGRHCCNGDCSKNVDYHQCQVNCHNVYDVEHYVTYKVENVTAEARFFLCDTTNSYQQAVECSEREFTFLWFDDLLHAYYIDEDTQQFFDFFITCFATFGSLALIYPTFKRIIIGNDQNINQ